jgi:drug/metabolite transporter (DMT)-like permease
MSGNFTAVMATKSSQLEKKVEGFCLIVAPLLFAASTFFWNNGEYGVESAILIIFSMFFWIPALTGLFSLVKNEMPRYAVWGLWIAVFGCISGVCFAFLGYLAAVFNISHEQYLNSLSHYPITSQVLLFGSGPLFPLSILVLGINLLLKRSVPAWISSLFCLAAITFPLSRIPRIEWIAHIADLAMLIPSAAIASQLLNDRG